MNKTILMVIAPEGYKEEELFIPKQTFEKNNITVYLTAKDVAAAKGTQGTVINIDKQFSEIEMQEFDAIVFVGGPGAMSYLKDKEVQNIAKQASKAKKIIGAICVAPSILANAGLLKGKKATAFQSEESNLKSKGATLTKEDVTVDGKIVTANGPDTAQKFAEAIVKLLKE